MPCFWAAPRRTEIAAVAESKIWILGSQKEVELRAFSALKPMGILAYGD